MQGSSYLFCQSANVVNGNTEPVGDERRHLMGWSDSATEGRGYGIKGLGGDVRRLEVEMDGATRWSAHV